MREEYISRINKVIDYIELNINKELKLEKLARVANFSMFHFHRIFTSIMNEPLNQFIQRIRIEKAAILLITNPKKSITEIAFDCGFSGSASFARMFNETFGMSASSWRKKYNLYDSKIRNMKSKSGKQVGKNRKDFGFFVQYIGSDNNKQIWRVKMENKKELQVEVKEVPDMCVAYIRHVGPFKGDAQLFDSLFTKLMKWAAPRGLINFPETKVMAVYHDDPSITDESKLRLSCCISVPENTEVGGEIGRMTVSGGKYAVARFECGADGYPDAWKSFYGGWLPESGYQPDDKPPFELYLNDPKEHPENKHIFEIWMPVKPM